MTLNQRERSTDRDKLSKVETERQRRGAHESWLGSVECSASHIGEAYQAVAPLPGRMPPRPSAFETRTGTSPPSPSKTASTRSSR